MLRRAARPRGAQEARRESSRKQNIDALLAGNYDAILTNAAGCGSTLKEYRRAAGR